MSASISPVARATRATRLFQHLLVLAGVLGLALAVACSVDVDVAHKACPCGADYVCDEARQICVTPAELAALPPVTPPCVGDACMCGVDLDCKDPARPRCSPAKLCVECGRMPDTCPAGSYCNELFQCTLGCKQESDCKISPTVPHCDAKRHQCVECTTNSQCTGGKSCSPSGACVETCDPTTKPCVTGSCCGGLCIATDADPLNCGGCGTACSTKNGTPKCATGMCSWTCAVGFTHCDSGNTGCETNTRSDVAHCGSCAKRCDNLNANGAACTAGACTYTSCLPGHADCDGNKTNGCECACGAIRNDPCCPGDTCVNGLSCNTNGSQHKCQ